MVQSVSGKTCISILRRCGPLEPWFRKDLEAGWQRQK